MFYTYRELTKEEHKKLNPNEFYPGAIGFGETREAAEFAYAENGGKRYVPTTTTSKEKTPFIVIDTVKQQAAQSYYPW